MLDRYGVDSPLRIKSANEKLHRTLSEKTASEKAASNEKRKRTNMERYSVEFQGMIPEIAKIISEKRKNLPHDVKADIVRRRKATKLRKYDDENWTNREKASEMVRSRTDAERMEIGDRIRKTNIERYGVGNVMDVPEIAGKVSERAAARSYGNLVEDEYVETRVRRDVLRRAFRRTPHVEMPPVWKDVRPEEIRASTVHRQVS